VKLRVLWFGRLGANREADRIVESYRQRVDRRWPALDRPLRPVAGGRANDPRRVLREEARLVDRSLEPGHRVVTLDEAGRRMTSEQLARWLADREDGAVAGLDFIIGSDLGIDAGLIDRADLVLSLSAMTLAHPLARIVLWEQLFRATHILGGGAYHRPKVQ
jgi:23S rRNA (pseudouridine1915-N3)-methyltransferase